MLCLDMKLAVLRRLLGEGSSAGFSRGFSDQSLSAISWSPTVATSPGTTDGVRLLQTCISEAVEICREKQKDILYLQRSLGNEQLAQSVVVPSTWPASFPDVVHKALNYKSVSRWIMTRMPISFLLDIRIGQSWPRPDTIIDSNASAYVYFYFRLEIAGHDFMIPCALAIDSPPGR